MSIVPARPGHDGDALASWSHARTSLAIARRVEISAFYAWGEAGGTAAYRAAREQLDAAAAAERQAWFQVSTEGDGQPESPFHWYCSSCGAWAICGGTDDLCSGCRLADGPAGVAPRGHGLAVVAQQRRPIGRRDGAGHAAARR